MGFPKSHAEALTKLHAVCENARSFDHTVYVRRKDAPDGTSPMVFERAVAYRLGPEWLGVATSAGVMAVCPVAEVSLWTGPPTR